jgi:hypothetical protein
MGGFAPIYDSEETEELSEKDRQTLRDAVLHELNTHPEIRELLRKRTLPLYEKLKKKRRK